MAEKHSNLLEKQPSQNQGEGNQQIKIDLNKYKQPKNENNH